MSGGVFKERGSRGVGRYIEMSELTSTYSDHHGHGGGHDDHESLVHPTLQGGPHDREDSDTLHQRLKRMSAFETQNYDPVDNDLETELKQNMTGKAYKHADEWKWVIAAATGFVMGLLAWAAELFIKWLRNIKYGSVLRMIEYAPTNYFGHYMLFVTISCSFAVVACSMVSYVEVFAAGSGIPELKAYLNGVHLPGLLRLRTLVAKYVGLCFSVSSGFMAGKEGPFVHIGGIVGGGLSQMGSKALGFKLGFCNYFRNDADKRDFVAIGAAAGCAVAFGAPIGGCLVAIEDCASFYSTGLLWRGFLSCCTGVVTVFWLEGLWNEPDLMLSSHFGVHRVFGLYADDIAKYSTLYYWYIWEIPLFVLVGSCGGAVGALFVFGNKHLTYLRRKYNPPTKKHMRVVEGVVLCWITATIYFLAVRFSPCKLIPESSLRLNTITLQSNHLDTAFGERNYNDIVNAYFQRIYCPVGYYSTYGQMFFTSLGNALKLMIHLGELAPDQQYDLDWGVIWAWFLVMLTLMTATFGVGAPTGLFIPALALGGSFGAIWGRIFEVTIDAMGFSNQVQISLHAYPVLGMAAILAGATRMTIAVVVLCIETTGALQLVAPLMLVTFCSKTVADMLSHGIYDTHIAIRGTPFLEAHDQPGFAEHGFMAEDKLKVGEVMTESLVTLRPRLLARDLAAVLKSNTHGAYPVTDMSPDPGQEVELLGVILRSQLLKMLQFRIGFYPAPPPGIAAEMPADGENGGKGVVSGYRLPPSLAGKQALAEQMAESPFKALPAEKIGEMGLTDAELGMMVDLSPFMQRHPHIIHADCNLARAYRFFRIMGLRHMFVTPARPHVVGMITRKDISVENARLTIGEKATANAKTTSYGEAYDMPFVPFAYNATTGDE